MRLKWLLHIGFYDYCRGMACRGHTGIWDPIVQMASDFLRIATFPTDIKVSACIPFAAVASPGGLQKPAYQQRLSGKITTRCFESRGGFLCAELCPLHPSFITPPLAGVIKVG
jgi:hypothetical protein